MAIVDRMFSSAMGKRADLWLFLLIIKANVTSFKKEHVNSGWLESMFLDLVNSHLVQNNLSFLYFLDPTQTATFRKSEFPDSHSIHSTSNVPNKYQSPISLTIPAANKQVEGMHMHALKIAVAGQVRQKKWELQPPSGDAHACANPIFILALTQVTTNLAHNSYFNLLNLTFIPICALTYPQPSPQSSSNPNPHCTPNPHLRLHLTPALTLPPTLTPVFIQPQPFLYPPTLTPIFIQPQPSLYFQPSSQALSNPNPFSISQRSPQASSNPSPFSNPNPHTRLLPMRLELKSR